MNIMEKLGEKGLSYLSAFEELAKQYAPDVVEAGLMVVRIHSIQRLVIGFLFMVVIGVGVWFLRQAYKANQRGDDPIGWGLLGGIFSVVGGIVGPAHLFNVWYWVAIFEPKLYIAHRIFEKLL